MPPKVKIFLWLAARNKLLTSDNLAKRGWIEPSMCHLCGRATKNLEHIFFQCAFAVQVWSYILQGEHIITGPLLAQEGSLATRWCRSRLSLIGLRKKLLDLGFAATCWERWLERNRKIFSGKLGRSSDCGARVEATVCRWLVVWGK